jgi:alkaline phosphatase
MSVKVALVTVVHYADMPPRGTRFYRESLGKLREAVDVLVPRRPDLTVCLGDLIDGPDRIDPEAERRHLRGIGTEFKKLAPRRAYVLANHCVNALSRGEFLRTVGQRKSYFSLDIGGWHLVVLDACLRMGGVGYAPGKFAWDDCEIPAKDRSAHGRLLPPVARSGAGREARRT